MEKLLVCITCTAIVLSYGHCSTNSNSTIANVTSEVSSTLPNIEPTKIDITNISDVSLSSMQKQKENSTTVVDERKKDISESLKSDELTKQNGNVSTLDKTITIEPNMTKITQVTSNNISPTTDSKNDKSSKSIKITKLTKHVDSITMDPRKEFQTVKAINPEPVESFNASRSEVLVERGSGNSTGLSGKSEFLFKENRDEISNQNKTDNSTNLGVEQELEGTDTDYMVNDDAGAIGEVQEVQTGTTEVGDLFTQRDEDPGATTKGFNKAGNKSTTNQDDELPVQSVNTSAPGDSRQDETSSKKHVAIGKIKEACSNCSVKTTETNKKLLLDITKQILEKSQATTSIPQFDFDYFNASFANENETFGTNETFRVSPQFPWPVKKEAVMEGDIVLGGLMMVHEREERITCGPVMPQGGIQALEAMMYTLDKVNEWNMLPNITVGAHVLDDCDKDTYGLEMAVDFIKAWPDDDR